MRRTIAKTGSDAYGETEPRRRRALCGCLTQSPAFLPPADKHFAKAWKMLTLLRNSFIYKKTEMSPRHDISGEDLRGFPKQFPEWNGSGSDPKRRAQSPEPIVACLLLRILSTSAEVRRRT